MVQKWFILLQSLNIFEKVRLFLETLLTTAKKDLISNFNRPNPTKDLSTKDLNPTKALKSNV